MTHATTGRNCDAVYQRAVGTVIGSWRIFSVIYSSPRLFSAHCVLCGYAGTPQCANVMRGKSKSCLSCARKAQHADRRGRVVEAPRPVVKPIEYAPEVCGCTYFDGVLRRVCKRCAVRGAA